MFTNINLLSKSAKEIWLEKIKSNLDDIKSLNLDISKNLKDEISAISSTLWLIISSNWNYSNLKIKEKTDIIECKNVDFILETLEYELINILWNKKKEDIEFDLQLAELDVSEKKDKAKIEKTQASRINLSSSISEKNEHAKKLKQIELIEKLIQNISDFRKKFLNIISENSSANIPLINNSNSTKNIELNETKIPLPELKKTLVNPSNIQQNIKKLAIKPLNTKQEIKKLEEKVFYSTDIKEIEDFYNKSINTEKVEDFKKFLEKHFKNLNTMTKLEIILFLLRDEIITKDYIKKELFIFIKPNLSKEKEYRLWLSLESILIPKIIEVKRPDFMESLLSQNNSDELINPININQESKKDSISTSELITDSTEIIKYNSKNKVIKTINRNNPIKIVSKNTYKSMIDFLSNNDYDWLIDYVLSLNTFKKNEKIDKNDEILSLFNDISNEKLDSIFWLLSSKNILSTDINDGSYYFTFKFFLKVLIKTGKFDILNKYFDELSFWKKKKLIDILISKQVDFLTNVEFSKKINEVIELVKVSGIKTEFELELIMKYWNYLEEANETNNNSFEEKFKNINLKSVFKK